MTRGRKTGQQKSQERVKNRVEQRQNHRSKDSRVILGGGGISSSNRRVDTEQNLHFGGSQRPRKDSKISKRPRKGSIEKKGKPKQLRKQYETMDDEEDNGTA